MTLRYSRKPIRDALEAVQKGKAAWEEINGKIADLRVPDAILDGARRVAEYQAQVEELRREQQAAAESAVAAVRRARGAWDQEVRDHLTPDGADLGGPDLMLLDRGLIETPTELHRVMDRHGDSIAFQRASELYAKERHWDGFTAEDAQGAAVEAFADEVFKQMEIAARNPDGYFGMLFAEPGVLDGMATQAGCASQWQAGED